MQEMLKLAALAFLPAGILATFSFAVGWIRRRNEIAPQCCAYWPDWSALGVSVAFLWGYLVINQTWVPNPGRGIIHWLPWLLILGLVLGPASRCCSRVFRLAALGLTLVLLVLFFGKIASAYPNWSTGEAILVIGGTSLLVLGMVFANLRPAIANLPAWNTFLVYGLVIAAAIPSFFIAGSSKWAQVIAVVGLICIPGFLIALKREARLGASAIFQLTTVVWALLVYVYFFTDYLPLGAFLILLLGPAVALAILSLTNSSPKRKMWLVVAFVGLGMAGALAVALTKSAAPPPSPYL
tara:strand:- start:971 stop:1858 length:888 start_codon:yes stop_codon:yes gene_type:complete